MYTILITMSIRHPRKKEIYGKDTRLIGNRKEKRGATIYSYDYIYS